MSELQRREATLVLYDLRDAEQWTAASSACQAWGREHSLIHKVTNDLIVIEFRAGGALALPEEGGEGGEA